MRIAVCDSSREERELFVALLKEYFLHKTCMTHYILYENATQLLYDVEDGESFDLIFLGVDRNGSNRINAAFSLREKNYEGKLVLISAYPEYAVDGYEVGAAAYLLRKNFREKLGRVLERVTEHCVENVYAIKQRSRIVRIPYGEIIYIESNNSKCLLHRNDGNIYTIYKRLDQIEQELADRRFLRSHQSYLVNMDGIVQADHGFRLYNGEEILIRQKDAKGIKRKWITYIGGNYGKTELETGKYALSASCGNG